MATASTKRNPAISGGVVGAAATSLASVTLVTAPFPADPETVERYKLQSPRKTYVTDIMSVVDILEGDILTCDSVDYKVVVVMKWTDPVSHTKLLMEKQQ
jgi:hypothetical protein